MSAFAYRDGVLSADGVPLDWVASSVGSPVYCYSGGAITTAYRAFEAAFDSRPETRGRTTICYAVKANGNLSVVSTLAALGAGCDIVSEGELRRALAAGVPPGRIVFSGVGKTRDEMAYALQAGIMQINVESAEELEALSRVATACGRTARVAIRVNPDVDAETHSKISTGQRHDKFGVAWDEAPGLFRRARKLPGIDLVGIAVHIGSQLIRLEPYRQAFRRIVELVHGLRADGVPIRRIDFGGGLGISYRGETPPDIDAYAGIIAEAVRGLDCDVVIEPGRRLVGPAGVLLTRVVRVKKTPERSFIIVDAAMNDLVRPAMYDAYHEFLPVRRPAPDAPAAEVDIVGPICESTDIFARDRLLPPVKEGDLLAIANAGAYGAVMSSEYNGRPLVPEVLLQDGTWKIVRRRPTWDEMLALEAPALDRER